MAAAADAFSQAEPSEPAGSPTDLGCSLLSDAPLARAASGLLAAAPRVTSFLQGRRIAFAVAVLNIMNAIMGAGILSLPYWMAQNGMVLFIVLQLSVMLVVDLSLQMLVGASRTQHIFTYDGLGLAAFGRTGKWAVCSSIIIQNVGAIISYLIILGDLG